MATKSDNLLTVITARTSLCGNFILNTPWRGKKFWAYVDGLMQVPDLVREPEQYKKQREANAKIVSLSLSFVEAHTTLGLKSFGTIKDMFKYLKRVHLQSDFARKYQPENDMAQFRQRDRSTHEY